MRLNFNFILFLLRGRRFRMIPESSWLFFALDLCIIIFIISIFEFFFRRMAMLINTFKRFHFNFIVNTRWSLFLQDILNIFGLSQNIIILYILIF